jgi:hemimethylated DNA binding protein
MVYSTRYDQNTNRQVSDRTDRSSPDLFVPRRYFRPHKDQPFYHLLAENSESEYVAYVSEQNLLPDDSGKPIRHSQVAEIFVKDKSGGYRPRNPSLN